MMQKSDLSPCCQAKLICDLNGNNVRCFDCDLPVNPDRMKH